MKAVASTELAAAAEVQALVDGAHPDPFGLLGPHLLADGRTCIRVFIPDADSVTAVGSGDQRVSLSCIHPAGFFAGALPGRRQPGAYRLEVTAGNDRRTVDDAYRFPSSLDERAVYLFNEGTEERAYRWMGPTVMSLEGVPGVRFTTWAPNAHRVSVVGDFNGWDGRRHPMRRHPAAGIWEIFVPAVTAGACYKYEILPAVRGRHLLKADPYAQACQCPPATASVVPAADTFTWPDDVWMSARGARQHREAPICIYEVHLGSWRRKVEEGDRYLTYDELAEALLPYARDMNFTHLQLMPVSEYPFDGSWGYQPIGLFAPSSRFGDAAGFRRFVARAHTEGLGVLVDWVPGHFPSDDHGLARFDGTCLYEHEDRRRGFHPDWNTLIYNYGRREVAAFLHSNALAWLDRFHVDGLRVDAVASMLYLDYSRRHGEWLPNRYGGRENLEAVAFLRDLNTRAYAAYPGIMTIAEESTAWPGVSTPADAGGLGFGFKWNMGWMNDTLRYMEREPIHRAHHHNELTFSLVYAFHENFILPISHDEVVHGKGSLLAKMPGDQWQQFANLRAFYGYMWTHPGKKLLFMGSEFAQSGEWNHDRSLDWHELNGHENQGVQQLIRDLNAMYRSRPALHVLDCEHAGFEWVIPDNASDSVLAFLRKSRNGAFVVVVCNLTPVTRERYRVGVPVTGHYREIMNTDSHLYGGSNRGNLGGVQAQAAGSHGQPCSISITLPPLATIVFELDAPTSGRV